MFETPFSTQAVPVGTVANQHVSTVGVDGGDDGGGDGGGDEGEGESDGDGDGGDGVGMGRRLGWGGLELTATT